ncbi:MAG TPA: right-handed parallel beta-helix repeat-containing protein [Phycisphaerales bacterium]|nr:right-handed parallel beta-helix repeat-containing protein [Phycisphaerales bacterium]
MQSKGVSRVLPMAAGVVVLAAGYLVAGPLNPPAGPITSTGKTLTEVEPRTAISAANTPGNATAVVRITQPGSYYLTANLVGETGKHGIDIASSGVTVDLNGFEVIGVGVSGGAFDGVRAFGAFKNITVRNGHVRNWGDDGVEIANVVNSVGARVEDVQSTGNGGSGISCSTDNGVVLRCTASENGATGISATRLVSGCTSTNNTTFGITMGQGGSILDSMAFANGDDGVRTGFGCIIVNCTSDNNTGDGIEASNGTTITNCSFLANGGSGINIFSSITVRNCTAVSNTLYGIDADTSCHIEGCTANSNQLDGIRIGSRGVVRNNLANSNGPSEIGAGIHGIGSDTRFEGNTCNNNDFGITVDGTGNIIINNTCANNVQAFVLVADNLYGPIIDRRIPTTVPSTPPVAGFSATGTMGSTDSRANFAQ